jgi:hypothetical protein
MTIHKEVSAERWENANQEEKIQLLKLYRPDLVKQIKDEIVIEEADNFESAKNSFADELGIKLDTKETKNQFMEDLK